MGSRTESKRFACALALGLALAACGDDAAGDDFEVTKDGGADAGAGRDGGPGMGGRGAGTGGGSGIDAGTAGSGTAGSGSAGTTAVNMCDPGIEPETRCGGEDCPGIPAGAAQCTVSCCVNDRCGTRNSGSSGRNCEPLARETRQCPDYDGQSTSGDPIMLVGCCTAGGQCGVVSLLHRTCIVTSPSVMLPVVPQSCDPDAIDQDAGVDSDAGTD